MKENNGVSNKLQSGNDKFNYLEGDVPICDDDSPSITACVDEQDACVKYSIDIYHFFSEVSTNDHYYDASLKQYRCGKASDMTELGGSPHCYELRDRFSNIVDPGTSNWGYDACEEEVTERRETGGGSEGGSGEESGGGAGSGGESDSKDCRYEMCGGGEAAQLTFVLAAACMMVYGVF